MNRIFSLAFLFTMALVSFNAKSALITQTLDVEVIVGPGVGELGSIDITYDDSLIIGSGEEFINGVDVEMTLFGQIFLGTDDIEPPDYPELGFFDGEMIYLDFVIAELAGPGLNSTEIDDVRIGGISSYDIIFADLLLEVTTVEVEGVNAPGTVMLFSFALFVLSFYQRKR